MRKIVKSSLMYVLYKYSAKLYFILQSAKFFAYFRAKFHVTIFSLFFRPHFHIILSPVFS